MDTIIVSCGNCHQKLYEVTIPTLESEEKLIKTIGGTDGGLCQQCHEIVRFGMQELCDLVYRKQKVKLVTRNRKGERKFTLYGRIETQWDIIECGMTYTEALGWKKLLEEKGEIDAVHKMVRHNFKWEDLGVWDGEPLEKPLWEKEEKK